MTLLIASYLSVNGDGWFNARAHSRGASEIQNVTKASSRRRVQGNSWAKCINSLRNLEDFLCPTPSNP
jgi:hypothetical protein